MTRDEREPLSIPRQETLSLPVDAPTGGLEKPSKTQETKGSHLRIGHFEDTTLNYNYNL